MAKKVPKNKPSNVRLIGYARVSTAEQSLQMQIEALTKAGVRKDDLHVEKVSGAASKRPALEWALETCRPGDTFCVWKMDKRRQADERRLEH